MILSYPPFLTPILKDEPLASYVDRIRPSWNYRRSVKVVQRLSPKFDSARYALPGSLDFLQDMSDVLEVSARRLLLDHTNWAWVELLRPEKDSRCRPLRGLFAENGAIAGDRRAIREGPSANGWSLGICPACVIDDVHTHGVATVRRQHLLQGMPICVKHRSAIMGMCQNCIEKARSYKAMRLSIAPTCACGNSLKSRLSGITSSIQLDIELRVAMMLEALFQLGMRYFRGMRPTLHTVFRTASENACLMSLNGVIAENALVDYSIERLGRETFQRYELSSARLMSPLLRNPLFTRLIDYAIVAVILFDEPDSFNEAIRVEANSTEERA